MALQESGAISLSDIQTEFGGSNPISISEYYRDAGYVYDPDIQTSGTISLSDFYGAQAVAEGSVSLVYSANRPSSSLTIPTPSTPDAWRWMVVVMSEFSGDGIAAYTATLNGTAMTEITQLYSTAADDGHRIAIFYAPIPTGSEQSFVMTGGYFKIAAYVVHGIEDFSTNFNLTTGTTNASITATALSRTNDAFAVGTFVGNFAANTSVTNTDDVYPDVATAAIIFEDTIMAADSVTYQNNDYTDNKISAVIAVNYDI